MALVAVLLLVSCSGRVGQGPETLREPEMGAEAFDADPEDARRLEALAQIFYERVSFRRFNSIATFKDPALREFFRTEDSFADYFAEFVQDLTDARFERNHAIGMEIQAVELPAPGEARVRVRFWGDNARPLRFWRVELVREDQWESEEGRWWIVPGKV